MHEGRGRRGVVVGVVVAALLLSAVAPSAVAATRMQTQPEADNTVTRIQVHANGSATWSVRIRTRLDSDEAVDRYRAFQAAFRNNTDVYLSAFRDRIRGVVADAENATGREMNATGFSATTHIQELPRRWGVVTYEFAWTGFANRSGDALLAGDVFQGGFFLAGNDTLVVESPEEYAIMDARPSPAGSEEGSVTWAGERNFDDERPSVRFVRLTPSPTPTSTMQTDSSTSTASPTPTETSTGGISGPGEITESPTGTTPTESSMDLPLVGVALFILLALATGLLLVRRGGFFPDNGGADTRSNGGDGSPPDGPEDSVAPDDQTNQSPPSELPTDAERVERLLESNGGRMRQADVADELGWSASKTSRVLSDMAEEDRVEKLRLGRENVIDLPGREES